MPMKTPERGRGQGEVRPVLEAVRLHIRNGRLYEAKEAAACLLVSPPSSGAAVALGRALEYRSAGVEGRLVLGLALREQGRAAEAEQVLRDALSQQPKQPALLLEVANALADLGRRDEAIAALDQAVRILPSYLAAHFNLGNMLREAGRLDDAVAAYEAALRLKPDYAEAHYNLGITLQNLRQSERAIAAYRRAAELRPGHVGSVFNLGSELRSQGRPADAASAFRRAIALKPDYAEAHYNLGNALRDLKRPAEAAAAYRAALAIKPDYDAAQRHLAFALWDQGQASEAEQHLRASLQRNPDDLVIEEMLGELLRLTNRLSEARAVFEAIVARQPDHPEACAWLLQLKSMVCDWRGRDGDFVHLMMVTERQIAAGQRTGLSAFNALFFPVPAEIGLAIGRTWAAETERMVARDRDGLDFRFERRRKDRLRIAYVSSDFRDHPMAHLLGGLFRIHDRAGFEVFAVSHGPDDGSRYRARIATEAEHFLDIAPLTDRDAALRLYREGIDILVDLNGYTHGHRLGIAALRPAPIVATYLGFPGSSGAPFIDYAIVDSVVAPASEAHLYSERLVHLPHCYLINDRDHPIDGAPLTRRDAGLPDDGFVFCCFNGGQKIEPSIFDVWMRILRQVPGSVLWLLQLAPDVADNLRREAAARGIDGDRLVFGSKLPKPNHLARHRLADLFLDTRYCGAHTTCSDALLVGLPVLTCRGERFVARVATSLLLAAGLPELVVEDLAQYEARAVALAREPAQLGELRERLHTQRSICPAFDAQRLVRNFERAYRSMWETYLAGEPPRALTVRDEGAGQL
jgi:predicted O-linked N-acetylglucosamine transferase (SPINDLY family)